MCVVKCISSVPKNIIKSTSKAKHEERTQRNTELDEFCKTQWVRIIRRPTSRTIRANQPDYPTLWKPGRTMPRSIHQRGCLIRFRISLRVGLSDTCKRTSDKGSGDSAESMYFRYGILASGSDDPTWQLQSVGLIGRSNDHGRYFGIQNWPLHRMIRRRTQNTSD